MHLRLKRLLRIKQQKSVILSFMIIWNFIKRLANSKYIRELLWWAILPAIESLINNNNNWYKHYLNIN